MDRPGSVATLRKAVADFARTHLPGEERWCVALSGGADSLALTAVAAGVRRTTALIVDHRLQADSARVAATARRQAMDVGCVDAQVLSVDVGSGGGPEAAARNARYAALDAARDGAPVLLAHTLDDQAETVLLGLARGSGGRSIQGMVAWNSPWGRPLLGVRRAQTVRMCADLGIEPWHDPHNADLRYTRVRVRDEVLPLLEDVLGGGVAQALVRTADQLREDGAVLDAYGTELMRKARSHTGGTSPSVALPGRPDGGGGQPGDTETSDPRDTLSIEILATAPPALRRRAVRAWLADQGVTGLMNAHLQAIDELVSNWHGQGGVAVAGGSRDHRLVVTREHGTLAVRAQPRI